jgi:MFS family permease
VIVIADTAPHDQRARQMQWMMGMTRAGQLFGPSMGGFLAAGFGLWIPFAIYAALTVVAVIPAYNTIQETAPGRRRKNDDSEEGKEEVKAQGWAPVIKYMITFQILVFLVIQVFAQFCRGGQDQGSLNLYAVYAYNMGPGELGLLNTIAIMFGIPVPFITGYLMDKFGRRAVIAPGFAAYAIAVALMSLTAFFPLPTSYFLATYVLVQATAGTTGGTMQVLGTDLSPQENRGRFFGIWRTIAQLGATVAPAIYGLIAEHVGFGFAFLYLSLCAVGVVFGLSRVLGDTRAKR